jgi:hypothetical protein
LLGVTIFGLAAAMHLSYQSKLGPLESSRLLAYSPDGRSLIAVPTSRFDNPFSNMPGDPNAVLMRQPAGRSAMSLQQQAEPAEEPPLRTVAATTDQPADEPEPAALPVPDDHDTVDERAVVDPPLPFDQVPASAAETDTPAESAPDAPTEPAAAAVTPAETPAADTPATDRPAPDRLAPDAPAPSDAPAAPIETTAAAPAPVIETPPSTASTTASDTEPVGTIPATERTATDDDRPAADVPAVAERPDAAKAKRKRALRRPVAKARRSLRRAIAAPFGPSPSNGFPQFNPLPSASRPAKGFWIE